MAGLQYVHSSFVILPSDAPPGSDRALPRAQRRGAIIILGMLALAKRQIVADRVDSLVKVGLGKLGAVSCYVDILRRILAHYHIV